MKRKINIFLFGLIALSLASCESQSESNKTKEVLEGCNCNDVFLDPEYNYFYTEDRSIPYTGQCESKFADGSIKEVKNYLEGKLEGKYLEYYESGTVKSEWMFSAGRQHGESKGYYENGQLKYHTKFYKGEHDTTFVANP